MCSPALVFFYSDLGGSVREDDRPDRPHGQREERHHGPQHQCAPHAQEPGLPQEGLGDFSQEPGESSGSDSVQSAGQTSPTIFSPVITVNLSQSLFGSLIWIKYLIHPKSMLIQIRKEIHQCAAPINSENNYYIHNRTNIKANEQNQLVKQGSISWPACCWADQSDSLQPCITY